MNVQSLLCRKNEIEVFLNAKDVDVLCLTETWLTSNIPDSLIDFTGYNVFRCDKGRGGGCCIYVKNSLSVNMCNLNVPSIDGIEEVWLSIQSRKLPSIIIGCLYRHPHASNNTFDHILESFRAACLKKKAMYIVGDLNDDLMVSTAKINNIVKITKLSQLIGKPTRITSTSSTLLDVLITNKEDSILSIEVNPSIIADHEHISFIIDIMKPKREPVIVTSRSLKNYSPELLCNVLLDQTPVLNKIFNTDDVDKQI